MFQTIVHLSRKEAMDAVGYNTGCVISINDIHLTKLHSDWRAILPLIFHDTDTPAKNLIVFDTDQANQILNFVEHYKNQVDIIVVHCLAGISRSAGVAKALSEIYGVSEYPYKDIFLYNRHVYRVLMDTAFERGLLKQ